MDGLASALPGVDAGGSRRAAATLSVLAALAQRLGLTLLLLEEADWPPARNALPRGPLGAALRAASPAALFSLEWVPPREAEGPKVMRLVALMQRYAPLPSPLGLELVEGHGGEGWSLEPYPLMVGRTLVARAEAAILQALRVAGEGGLPRQVLLKEVMARATVKERTATTALANLRARGKVTEMALGGRGNPKLYRLVDSESFFAQKGESALRNGTDFGQSPLPQRMGEADPGEGRGTTPRGGGGFRVGGGAVTAWGALRARLPDLAAKIRVLQPPRLRVAVDGQVVYAAQVVPEEADLGAHSARFGGPSRLEGWLLERLALWEERFPGVREVELLGVWAGNPPRLEVIARVRPRSPSP